MALYTILDCRMQEKCHNQWTHTNTEKEITTSYPWPGVHILNCSPPLHSTGSRRHKLCQKDPTHHQNDTFSKSAPCSGWFWFIHFVTTLGQQKVQSMIQLLALEWLKYKKRKNAKKTPFLFFCVTLNILWLSATSQMGHIPTFWRPALLPTAGSLQ